MRRFAWLSFFLVAVVHGDSSAMHVTKAWSRATPPGAPVGVAYFTIENSGIGDTLLAIKCALAARVEMHSTRNADGLMQMRMEDTVKVPAHSSLKFEPGGLHAMLLDLKQPLRAGQAMSLTLVFQHAGDLSIQATVVGLGAGAP